MKERLLINLNFLYKVQNKTKKIQYSLASKFQGSEKARRFQNSRAGGSSFLSDLT